MGLTQLYETGPCSQHSIFLQLKNGPNKLECFFTLCWKGLQVTNALTYCGAGLTQFYGTGAVFTTLDFLHNLRMRPISQSVYITLCWKGQQEKHLLILPIHKYEIKLSVANTTPDALVGVWKLVDYFVVLHRWRCLLTILLAYWVGC